MRHQYRASIGVAVVVSLAVTASPATAAAPPPPPSQPPVQFIRTEDSTFADVYQSLMASNKSTAVSAFLEAQAVAKAPSLASIGLSEVGLVDARGILESASASAAVGSVRLDAATVTRLGAVASADVGPAPASVSSATVRGKAVASGRAWEYKDRATLVLCSWTCWDDSWSDYTLRTDPGQATTKTTLNINRLGKGNLTGATVRTVVLSAGRNISDVTNTWNLPASGAVQWNGSHASTKGKTFQMYYYIKFHGPAGSTGATEWKSAKSKACAVLSSGAYACLFS